MIKNIKGFFYFSFMKNIFLFVSLLLFSYNLFAQVPHLTGNVHISMNTGQISCDFVLSKIPNLGKDYQILLNKGFNIKSIKDSTNITLEYDGFYNGKMKGEGLVYVPQVKDSTLVNPKKLHITYTGAFPIYKDTLNFIDFKGLIAFNGKTLRAADQSKWYPVIYDVKADKLIEQLTYNITITCDHAETIFVNGDLPKPGPKAIFKSDIPIAPLLFIGNYKTQQTKNAIFLNTNMNKKQLEIFEENIAEIKGYYQKILGIKYDKKNIFIEHQQVEKYNKGRSWGFVTFPVIAFAGLDLGSLVDEKNNRLKDTADYPFIAHEIAHYYFGNVLQPNSKLMWFFLESTAEYLSVKASEAKFGKEFSANYYAKTTKALKNYKAIPLSTIQDMSKINSTYRYNYGPLLLKGLEQVVGEQKTINFLISCLESKNELTDYDFFKRNALKSGITESEWTNYEKDYILSENVTSLIK